MNIWEMLSANYISEFFTFWYLDPLGKISLILYLVGIFPFLCLLIAVTRLADHSSSGIWEKAKKWRWLILVKTARTKRVSGWFWFFVLVLWLLNLFYSVNHWLISTDPERFLSSGTLQTISSADFDVARQFLHRWISLGLVLAAFSTALFFKFLEYGFQLLTYRPTHIDSAHDPTLTIHCVVPDLVSEADTQENLPKTYYYADPHNSKTVFLSRSGRLRRSASDQDILEFTYDENNHHWVCSKLASMEIFFEGDRWNEERGKRMVDFHFFSWKNDEEKRDYWCKVIVR